MHNWKPGDVGIIHSVPTHHPQSRYNGEEVGVTSSPFLYDGRMLVGISRMDVTVGDFPYYNAIDIDHIRPKYDGDAPGSWEELRDIWVPAEPVAVVVDEAAPKQWFKVYVFLTSEKRG